MTDRADLIRFDLGALAPHIGTQIPALSEQDSEVIEGYRRAINRLRINGLLSPSEAKKAEGRLVERIRAALLREAAKALKGGE
jgi:hypothetical protein